MSRARSAGDSSPPGAMLATIQIPAGARGVTAAPPLWGVVCAPYLGMSEENAFRTLADMADDPAFRGCVVWLCKRPRELAAAPDDVIRFLRARRGMATSEAAPTNDDAPADGADRVLAEL